MSTGAIRAVQTGEVSKVAALLEAAELPIAGLEETDLFVLKEDETIVATVGIEVRSPIASSCLDFTALAEYL